MPFGYGVGSSTRPAPAPTLDRAVAFKTGYERPLPGSQAASDFGALSVTRAPLQPPPGWIGSASTGPSAAGSSTQGIKTRPGSFRKINSNPSTSTPKSSAPTSLISRSASTSALAPAVKPTFRPVNGSSSTATSSHTPVRSSLGTSGRDGDAQARPRPSDASRPSVGGTSNGKRPLSSSEVESAPAKRILGESGTMQQREEVDEPDWHSAGAESGPKKKRKKKKTRSATPNEPGAAAGLLHPPKSPAQLIGPTASSSDNPPSSSSSSDEIVETGGTVNYGKQETTIEAVMAHFATLAGTAPPKVSTPAAVAGSSKTPTNLSTPTGTLSAPISLTSTSASAASSSTLAPKPPPPPPAASSSRSRDPSSGDTPRAKAKVAVADVANSSSSDESIIEMDLPIVISSSGESSGGGGEAMDVDLDNAKAAKRARRLERERLRVERPKKKAAGTCTVYYQGKVEVLEGAGSDMHIGLVKIIRDGDEAYELRLCFAPVADQQPKEDIVCSKAELVDAKFDQEKRTMRWRPQGETFVVRFLETSSCIHFTKAFNVTLKTAPIQSPSLPRISTSAHTSSKASPKKDKTGQSNEAGTSKSHAESSRLSTSQPSSSRLPSKDTSKFSFKKRDELSTSAQPLLAAPSGNASPPPLLQPRKIKPPARFDNDWPAAGTDDGTDGDVPLRPTRPKKKVKVKVKPAAVPEKKKAGDRSRIEDIAGSAVSAFKQPAAIGKHARAATSSTEFTIEIEQCNIGTGKVPLSAQGDLPKYCTIAITSEMAPDETYTQGVTMLREEIYFPTIRFDESGKKIMYFDPPLNFHLPAHIFRTLPRDWPYPRDKGYRRGQYVRVKMDFLGFLDKERRPSRWIIDEFGDFNNDMTLEYFQTPEASVTLIKPYHKTGDMDRQTIGNRAQLSIGGIDLSPEFAFSFKFKAYWDAAAAANAPAPAPLRKLGAARAGSPLRGAAGEVKRKGKGPLVLADEEEEEEEETTAEALSGLHIATNDADGSPGDDRSMSPLSEDNDDPNHCAKQAFTIAFQPSGPTFRPSPPRIAPKGSQQIQQGSLAHDLANLDREAVDNEIIEREEAIFDIEGIHDGQKFVMALWNRWCSTFGRIHPYNSRDHILGFIRRYFTVMHEKNVRRYLVVHLQVLSAYNLCENDTFAAALAENTRLTRQVLAQQAS